MAKKFPKDPYKNMFKGATAKRKDGMHRPEGAGNFDNMDDYNIVQTVNAKEINGAMISGAFYGDGTGITNISGDNLGDHVATKTISGTTIVMTGDISGANIIVDGTVDGVDVAGQVAFVTAAYDHISADGSSHANIAVVSGAAVANTASGAELLVKIDDNTASGAELIVMIDDNTASGAELKGLIDKNTASGQEIRTDHETVSGATVANRASGAEIRGDHNTLSGAYYPHAADASDPHTANLSQTFISGAVVSGGYVAITEDYETESGAYVANIIFGQGETPPTASGFTRGSVYLQYTL